MPLKPCRYGHILMRSKALVRLVQSCLLVGKQRHNSASRGMSAGGTVEIRRRVRFEMEKVLQQKEESNLWLAVVSPMRAL